MIKARFGLFRHFKFTNSEHLFKYQATDFGSYYPKLGIEITFISLEFNLITIANPKNLTKLTEILVILLVKVALQARIVDVATVAAVAVAAVAVV